MRKVVNIVTLASKPEIKLAKSRSGKDIAIVSHKVNRVGSLTAATGIQGAGETLSTFNGSNNDGRVAHIPVNRQGTMTYQELEKIINNPQQYGVYGISYTYAFDGTRWVVVNRRLRKVGQGFAINDVALTGDEAMLALKRSGLQSVNQSQQQNNATPTAYPGETQSTEQAPAAYPNPFKEDELPGV